MMKKVFVTPQVKASQAVSAMRMEGRRNGQQHRVS
jgi:hypothetical protein